MARDFVSVAFSIARDIARANARQHREAARFARRQEREAQRQQRAETLEYVASRRAEVDDKNEDLEAAIEQLDSLLQDALARTTAINWASLFQRVDEAAIDRDPSLALPGSEPVESTYLPKAPGRVARLIPGWDARHQRKLAAAKQRFAADAIRHAEVKQRRQAALANARKEVDAQNREVVVFRNAYRSADRTAVVAYFQAIFDRSHYPEGFLQNRRISFSSESRQLIVEFQAPTIDDVIPTVARYKYGKTADQITETIRPQKERHARYSAVLAQLTLRYLYEAFTADNEHVVEVVALNAFIDTLDPATGNPVRPCIISLRTTRAQFEELDLANVDPLACLKRLKASVSRSPAELVPVKPIVDISMVDPRFVEEADVLSDLDSRPNLMELTPSEFESLTTNLFAKMGLEARQTSASRDGGVECVAYDPRPILGGKVVVQAKRYKNTVGVSAVRDLYGTMMNEGASKGILLTTSGYGRAAYEFANGKPIELLDGSNLLYLLKEHAGIDAKIVAPETWVDARPAA